MSGTALPRYHVQRAGERGDLWDVYERGRADLQICRCRSYDMARVVASGLALATYVTAHTPAEELRGMPYLDLIEEYRAEGDPAPARQLEEGAE